MVNGKYSGLLLFNYIRTKYIDQNFYFVLNLRVALRALVSPSYKILKFKETITMFIHSKKTNINIFVSLAPNRIWKCGNFKLWFCKGRRGIVVKYMPHVQHAYFSLFNQ